MYFIYIIKYYNEVYFLNFFSAQLAIDSENGTFLCNQRIMVKTAEMKSQKHRLPANEMKETAEEEPMNKSN